MGLISMEHSQAACRADFVLYGAAVLMLAGYLALDAPRALQPGILAFTLAGLLAWSPLEYVLHRFVLHGLPPFSRWHALHHQRPTALICAPTVLSGSLIAGLVFLPALLLGGPWYACALTLGVSAGYLAYAITHHATHHWHADNAWLKRRQQWHALHHRRGGRPGCFGVTTVFWDHVFGSLRRPAACAAA